MAIAYPVGLPTLVESNSLNIKDEVGIIRSGVDIGKPMTRNSFTGTKSSVSWDITMTSSEVAWLLGWYSNTLNKSLNFDFPEPITGTLKEYSFITPPEVTHIGADQFRVSYNLRAYS